MNSTTQTEMIDAQARVIRSLNLVHSADTQYMIGAVQLENLFKLKTENDELRQRMKDDGEYICTLSERCERYRDALLKHKSENHRLTDKIEQLYEGAEEQKQRIKRLEDCAETAWGIIANVDSGSWQEQRADWREAATRWRDEQFHPELSERKAKEAKP